MFQLEECKSCSFVIHECAIPVKYWVDQDAGNIGRVLEQDMESKVLKIALMSKAIKNNPDAVNQDRGCAKALAESFDSSRKLVKKLSKKQKAKNQLCQRTKL